MMYLEVKKLFQMSFFLEACEKDVVFAGNGGGVWWGKGRANHF
jgi:hypothetical protein